MLDDLRGSSLNRPALARELYARWEDGRVKLLLTHAGLAARRANPELFAGGAYLPLQAEGPRAANLCAFARSAGGRLAVVIAPRLVAGLLDGAQLRPDAFAGTTVTLPQAGPLRDAITGEERQARDGRLAVDEAFSTLPIGLLIR